MAKKNDEGAKTSKNSKLEKRIAHLTEELESARAAVVATEKAARAAVKTAEKRARKAEKRAAKAAADAVAAAKRAAGKARGKKLTKAAGTTASAKPVAAPPVDHLVGPARVSSVDDTKVPQRKVATVSPAGTAYGDQSVASLRALARARGLRGYSSLRKDQLVALLDR